MVLTQKAIRDFLTSSVSHEPNVAALDLELHGGAMKLTIETSDLDTICLLVKFLKDNGFRCKNGKTLVRPTEGKSKP